MRRLILFVICLMALACGQAQLVEPPAPAPERPAATTPPPVAEPTTVAIEQPARENPLNTSTLPDNATLVARASEQVDVYSDPGEPEPIRTLDAATIIGTPTVLVVTDGPADGWARVMLPGRPNGSEGWVQVDGMTLSMVHGRIEVDLSDRTLVYYEGGDQILATPVAVGTSGSPTPTGLFFVTDNVTLADPGSPWGPHALGLSARSETVMEFNGGDGIIGIHGTNRPESIGDASSLGCVRVPNDVIARLHELVPLGTPVAISA